MSVFRFGAPTSSSTPIPKRIRGSRYDECCTPNLAFSTSPSLLQDITLEKLKLGMDIRMLSPACDSVEDNMDSSSDSTVKDEFSEASFCQGQDTNSEHQIDFSDMVMRNSSSGLTMKEYEEQLKKLTAENFNLKLRIYFVEERLSKVKGISDKEELVKKNIELQVACEAKSKELESKQELIYEASKALDTLQMEHEDQMKKLKKEKEKEIMELTNKIEALEQALKEALESKSPEINPAEYEKQIQALESKLSYEIERVKELQDLVKESHSEIEGCHIKLERLENESEQRLQRIEEISDELETKEQELKTAQYRIRKFEDELTSKLREEQIMKERLEEKTKTIDSLKASLGARDTAITLLEAKCAKERSSLQSVQAKFDSMNFQNNRLKAEIEMLHSRLKRCSDASSRNKRSPDEDIYKQKYEDFARAVEEREEAYSRRITEMEEKFMDKEAEIKEYKQLCSKSKKLEDDHRKACAALRNFIKRSTDEKKERENLKALLKAREEELMELRLQIKMNFNNSNSQDILVVDNKLSLAETGDNKIQQRSNEIETNHCCKEKDKEIELMLSNLEKKESLIEDYKEKMLACKCGVEEKIERIQELEAEIIVLKYQLEDKNEDNDPLKERLHNELESKKAEIERLNNELKKRNYNLQELVNKELWDKNKQIEKLEKRLNILSEKRELESMALNQQILSRDQQLKMLQDQFADLGLTMNMSMSVVPGSPTNGVINLPEVGDTSPDYVTKLKSMLMESLNEKKYLAMKVDELNEKLRNAPERDCGSKSVQNLKLECAKAKEDAVKAETFRREAADMCALLTLRLEELASFLDSLLANRELLNGIGAKRRQDIKHAVEKSRELSKHLTSSLIGNGDGTLVLHPNDESLAALLSSNISGINKTIDSFGASMCGDKVISEQSAIILRLRDQIQVLNEEIKQRDIEISHCQAERTRSSDVDESNLVHAATQFSEFDIRQQRPETTEMSRFEKQCPKTVVLLESKRKNSTHLQDASESEAWSEPDRSVSLARMGHIEDGILNLSIRGSKMDDSTEESSEETVNEKTRSSVKQSRNTESEIRRLQIRIKLLDEANEELRKELGMLKNGQGDLPFLTKFQKNEEANLIEKLKRTVDQLEQTKMTCKELEEKLTQALERAAMSAKQLAKANECVTALEEEVKNLKEELQSKTLDINKKTEKIKEVELKLEEKILESELRLLEAIKQKEAAERKTLEVECRLKEAENMSKEVETRVVEIEKKINETKKFKKETVLQFREAERSVDTAEKIMEEAERMKQDAERKSKDFQNYVDLMRKDVEERVKDAERKVKRAEKEKEEMEKHLSKLKKKLMEAEENKSEVEMKVKEGKETIQCMEEKLKELEVAMDQCNKEAQKRIKEIQKKADARVMELEHQIQEKEWIRKNEAEKKMLEAEKISRELEIGFKRQLDDAEKRVKESKDFAACTIKKMEEEFRRQEAEMRQKMLDVEREKESICSEYRKQLDEIRVEASELELELTRVTNEKIHLEEEIKRMLEKENALVKDNKEIKGRYEKSIQELELKLSKLTQNKSELASRLEEIESTNIDLASRISAIRGKEIMEHDFDGVSPPSSPAVTQSLLTNLLSEVEFGLHEINGNNQLPRQCDQLVLGVQSIEAFAPPRRNINSSPDLGIESDPGRFSSLEAQHQVNVDPVLITVEGKREESEVKRLENENAELRRRLVKTRQALEETLTQLSAANQRKKQVERAICKQLHKTHHVLKRARLNFEGQDSDYAE